MFVVFPKTFIITEGLLHTAGVGRANIYHRLYLPMLLLTRHNFLEIQFDLGCSNLRKSRNTIRLYYIKLYRSKHVGMGCVCVLLFNFLKNYFNTDLE